MEQKQRRAFRIQNRSEQILDLNNEGFSVVHITHDRYRVNKLLDVFLTHKEYFDLKRRERGYYTGTIKDFVKQYFDARPVMVFELVHEIPPPVVPQSFWFKCLLLVPVLKHFFGAYRDYLKVYEERKKARINPHTNLGQAFLKAYDTTKRTKKRKSDDNKNHGTGN